MPRCGYLRLTERKPGQFRFAGRGERGGPTTWQYVRLVNEWVAGIGLDPGKFGTHSLRRTKAVLIYGRTGNFRAVQLLLDIRRLRVRVATLESKSMTRSKSLRRSTAELLTRNRHTSDVIGGALRVADREEPDFR
jgi:integrase